MNKREVYGALQAGELTDWNMAAAEVIAAANGLVLTVAQRQRSEGRNKASRFFRFDEVLSLHVNGKVPLLRLKQPSPIARDESPLRSRQHPRTRSWVPGLLRLDTIFPKL